MSGSTNTSAGLTLQTKILLALLGAFALVGVVVRLAVAPGGATTAGNRLQAVPPAQAALSAAPAATALPSPASPTGPVQVSIMTTNTKAQWLRAVTDDFNAARQATAAGRPIEVEVLEVSGPDEFQQRLLDDAKSKPVLVSPGDMSFIETANQILKDMHRTPIPTGDCPPIVSIPTGFVMWRPMAEALGWPDKPIGWKDIVELSADPQGWAKYRHPEWGAFTFGHSQPPYSTSGFNVLASLAYAASGKTQGLTPEDVRSAAVVDAFRKVEQETYHYGSSTSGLLDLMRDGGPSYLHAATTSETAFVYSVQNSGDKFAAPWTWAFIFPAEGTFWSDNPTCIVNDDWVSQEQREAAKIYRDYLLGPAAQDKAVQIGLRPANPKTPLHCPICLEKGTDPRVTPATVARLAGVSGPTNEAILDVFRATKKKATVALLLDVSSSMQGVAIKNAVEGAVGFMERLHQDDEIEAYMFSEAVTPLQPSGRVGDTVEKLSKVVNMLYADGSTALYDAVCTAVGRVETLRKEDKAAGESRLYAVVLLSDGKDTNSKRSESEMFACLPSGEDVEEVKVYTIAFGDQADKDVLTRIANRTHGKMLEGTPENIGEVYKKISAEQ